MRVICIVQARLTSSRLPRKIMADIGGKPLLWHVLHRATKIPGLAGIVLAMPRHTDDAQVSAVAETFHVPIVYPPVPEQDVLARYWIAAELTSADAIMRLTADCPFLDPELSGHVLASFLQSGVEYAHNLAPESGYPDGLDTQVFTRDALSRAYDQATDTHDREHVCPWMARHCLRLCVANTEDGHHGHRKWSVDTMADLRRVRAMLDHVGHEVTDWRAFQRAEDYLAERAAAFR